MLVTEKPETALPQSYAGYRGVAWLGKRQALTVLPSVASLRALREFAKGTLAHKTTSATAIPFWSAMLPEGHPTGHMPKPRDCSCASAEPSSPAARPIRPPQPYLDRGI